MTLATWWAMVTAGFRRQSAYRLAMLAGLVANVAFGLVRSAQLSAASDSAGGTLAGYEHDQLMGFVWVSQGLLGAVNLFGGTEIAGRIKNGDVAVDFLRPVSLVGHHLATDMGRAVYTLVPRGVPSIAVGALTTGVALATVPSSWIAGAAAVLLGIAISYLAAHCLATLGFWFLETRGFEAAYMVVSTLLAGLGLPVAMFPGWLRTLAHSTPFPSMLQRPVDVLVGRTTGVDVWVSLATQVGWFVALLTLALLLTRAGRRTLEIQGG